MKFPRYLLSLCAILLLAVVVSASAETEEAEIEDQVAERNLLLRAAVYIIKKAVKWAAGHCVEEAAHNCKQHWKHPTELISCAVRFLEDNKGRCLTRG